MLAAHRADSALLVHDGPKAHSPSRVWHIAALMGHIPTSSPQRFPSPEGSTSPGSPDAVAGRSRGRLIPTHAERRALGGRVLAAVGAVDPVPLHQLIGRGVCPEVVSSLHLGVFQCTGPHCGEEHPKHKGAILDPPTDRRFGSMGLDSKEGNRVKKVLPNKDARIGPSTGSIRRASFS